MSQGKSDYHPMWAELGLDLEKHDALLNVLGQGYGEIFLNQRNRPNGMEYFNFVMSEIHGLRIKELLDAKKEGRPVVGSFCVFVPEELILAVNGVSVGLCTGADFGTQAAEEYLPRSTCALIKSYWGFTLERVCPYIACCDVVVGENTCDGKKKSYELFKEVFPQFYVMDMPQTKSEEGKAVLRAEYRRFASELEKLSAKKITADSLKNGIGIVNEKRKAMHRLSAVRSARPAPISGLDVLLANQVFFYDDPQRFTRSVGTLADELEQRAENGEGVCDDKTPRILVSGCPMAAPNWKLHSIVENAGAVIVGEESCVGERGTRNLTKDTGDTVDALIDNIVDRYFEIDCAIFTPNPSRLEHIKQMTDGCRADGVIHYALQFCQPYQMESHLVQQELGKAGIPVLRIETDYSAEDAGQLKTRVEAFIEQLQSRAG